MRKPAIKYEDSLIQSLKDPEEAAAYLSAHLGGEQEPDSEELFLLALRHVAQAHGFSDLANRAELGRESLYKALSKDGNPKFSTLKNLLKAMGLKLSVAVDKTKAS